MNSDQAGENAVDVTLRPEAACVLQGTHEVTSDEVGMRRFELPTALPPGLRSSRLYVTEGQCVTYRFAFDGDVNATVIAVLDAALGFQPRDELMQVVQQRSGLVLCGAGAPPCVGGHG